MTYEWYLLALAVAIFLGITIFVVPKFFKP